MDSDFLSRTKVGLEGRGGYYYLRCPERHDPEPYVTTYVYDCYGTPKFFDANEIRINNQTSSGCKEV